jgi:superfamily II DNA or RNA helicase
MVEWAGAKLTELRHRMPDAGGLVIAPSIQMAEYITALIELIDGERPMLVYSQMPNADSKIKAFRNTDKRWIVSVAMISEGVDIKRLRVLIYLPNALTELAFRQAIGRVVRSSGATDDTRAYVVMPSFEVFEGTLEGSRPRCRPTSAKTTKSPRDKSAAQYAKTKTSSL